MRPGVKGSGSYSRANAHPRLARSLLDVVIVVCVTRAPRKTLQHIMCRGLTRVRWLRWRRDMGLHPPLGVRTEHGT